MLTVTKETNVRVEKEYLISRFEMLDLDSLIMSSFHPLLVEPEAMVGLLPPFIQFSPLDLPFNPG